MVQLTSYTGKGLDRVDLSNLYYYKAGWHFYYDTDGNIGLVSIYPSSSEGYKKSSIKADGTFTMTFEGEEGLHVLNFFKRNKLHNYITSNKVGDYFSSYKKTVTLFYGENRALSYVSHFISIESEPTITSIRGRFTVEMNFKIHFNYLNSISTSSPFLEA